MTLDVIDLSLDPARTARDLDRICGERRVAAVRAIDGRDPQLRHE